MEQLEATVVKLLVNLQDLRIRDLEKENVQLKHNIEKSSQLILKLAKEVSEDINKLEASLQETKMENTTLVTLLGLKDREIELVNGKLKLADNIITEANCWVNRTPSFNATFFSFSCLQKDITDWRENNA